ncbi:winged helix-turn-helix domain-containing protein [Streptomyces sp. NPDC056224]|uniref:helix-turn-helix domain-containing protein n=1 Tax=Streptomyces sp. NPDC056224 TaxID=3345750 RepID=UPI0035DB82B1
MLCALCRRYAVPRWWWADGRGTGQERTSAAGCCGVDREGGSATRRWPVGSRDADVGQPLAQGPGPGRAAGPGVERSRRCPLQAHRGSTTPAGGELDAGPAAHGWDEDQCWTLARIAEVIHRRFAVDCTLAGVDLLLRRIGWSVQVPSRRAAERDEAKIALWQDERWPVIKRPRRTSAPGSASRTRQARGRGRAPAAPGGAGARRRS